MISVGDSDWSSSEDELMLVSSSNRPSTNSFGLSSSNKPATAPLTNGNSTKNPPVCSKADIQAEIDDCYDFHELQQSVISGNLKVVVELFEHFNCEADTELRSGWTFLFYALQYGHVDVVEFLVDKGADVNYHHQMFYPIMACYLNPHIAEDNILKCTEILLRAGALVNVHDRYHVTPLMMCSRLGYKEVAELLCTQHIDINKQDDQGWTALMYAASENHRDLVDVLLKSKASPFLQTYESQSCAEIAYECGHEKLYIYLEKLIHPDVTEFKDVIVTEDYGDPNSNKVHSMGDIDMFLNSIYLSNLVPLFQKHSITFETLLTMTNKDLERIGVIQLGVQKKILESIKSLHCSEWEMPNQTSTLHTLDLNSQDSAKVLKVYTKHLKYLNSTAAYLLSQFENSKKLQQEYDTNEIETSGLIDHFRTVYSVARSLTENIDDIDDVLTAKLGCCVINREDRNKRDPLELTCMFMFGIGLGIITSIGINKYLML